jgi:ADP-dependent NAD(P)H-hydrate dehydratase / NAD(P)H-hydrate epimerase
MPELLNVAEMRRADQCTIESGIPGIVLMENAGREIFRIVRHLADHRDPVLVICGTGNNGGDGFVVARHFAANGYRVCVAIAGDANNLRGDAAIAFERWGESFVGCSDALAGSYSLIVDAMFGAGLDREISGKYADYIAMINQSGTKVASIDLPSGIHGDTGQIMGSAVQADCTITFFRKKPGHLLLPGRSHCGDTHVVQIGIHAHCLQEIASQKWENDPQLWLPCLPMPEIDGHKYNRGHAVVIGGDRSHTGAARLAAQAALGIGAGLVTLASPSDALTVNSAHLTAVMVHETANNEALADLLADRRISAVALGPALGIDSSTRQKVFTALQSGCACVLDADALTGFADDPEELFKAIRTHARPCVLTPHEGEFARLFGEDIPQGEKAERACEAARRSGAIVVLKGADTVIAAPDGRMAINANATGWLATAGAGDVLTGMICGLLAQYMPAFEAACAAVWMHGEAARRHGPGLTAERLSGQFPDILAVC